MSETAAKPKGRKRLTDEEKEARRVAAEEKKRAAEEKKAMKLVEAESKKYLKAALDDLKRQQSELRAIAAMEDQKQRCEVVRQYAAKMKVLVERKQRSLRESGTFDRPICAGGALRSPPGNDVIYEETIEPIEPAGEQDGEAELEEVDWDEIELPSVD